MKRKAKQRLKESKLFQHYFARSRDYLSIIDVECEFFAALAQKKDELIGNYTIHKALAAANQFLEDPQGRPVQVLVRFEVNDPRTEAPHLIYLGTSLSPANGQAHAQVSHYLCLGDGSSLLTKLHHDHDFNPIATERKPSPHMQTGGRVDTTLSGMGGGPCCWRDDVDKPRVPSIPFCTALLWHWAFLEYPDAEQIAPIVKTSWWPRIVKDAEISLLKPFFNDGFKLLDERPAMGLLKALYEPVAK